MRFSCIIIIIYVLQVDENLSPTDELSDLALNILSRYNSQSTTGIKSYVLHILISIAP